MNGFDVSLEHQDDRDMLVLRRFRDLARHLRHICEPLWVQWNPACWIDELQLRQSAAIGAMTLRRPNLEDPLFVIWAISNTWEDVFDRLFRRELLDSLHEVRIFRNRASHPGHEHGPIGSSELKHFETLCSRILAEFSTIAATEAVSRRTTTGGVPNSGNDSPQPEAEQVEWLAPLDEAPLREVVPIYLLIDRSDSMSGGGIGAINTGLSNTLNQLGSDPLLNDRCRVSILQFNQRCEVVVSLSSLRDASMFAPIKPDGITNWGEALRVVRREVAKDHDALKTAGYRAMRPLVFMISDGAPLDADWLAEWASTADPRSVQSCVMFFYGVGSVPAEICTSLVTIPGMSPDRVQNLAVDGDLTGHIAVALGSIMGSIACTIRDPELRVAAL